MKGKNMGAFENIEELDAILHDCVDENKRIWDMPYNPYDKDQIRYRYNFYCDHMKDLEDVASDVLDLCKDWIENNPKMKYKLYHDEVFHNLNQAHAWKDKKSLWFRSLVLLVWFYDKVKIYEQEEDEEVCTYSWNISGEVLKKLKGTNYLLLMSKDQNENFALYEYCRLRESLEYILLSRLCHYKDSKQENVNIDYKDQLFLFAHTVCLYTAMHNERIQVLKDARYAGLNPEELRNTPTPASQAKRTKPVKIPHELNTPKGRKLLQKVIKAGFCDKFYNWDDSKWNKGKSRLALACFAYRASEYLNLSTKTNKEGEPTTSWQPFETLFTYQGKEEGKNKLMQTKRDYMKTKTSFNPEEMDAISKLFH